MTRQTKQNDTTLMTTFFPCPLAFFGGGRDVLSVFRHHRMGSGIGNTKGFLGREGHTTIQDGGRHCMLAWYGWDIGELMVWELGGDTPAYLGVFVFVCFFSFFSFFLFFSFSFQLRLLLVVSATWLTLGYVGCPSRYVTGFAASLPLALMATRRGAALGMLAYHTALHFTHPTGLFPKRDGGCD